MSDSVRPHRRQPTRLPHRWDSPGKNTGVGCHFLLQCMKVKSQSEVAQSCLILSEPMDCSLPGSSVHGIFQARVLEWGAIAFSNRFNVIPNKISSFFCRYRHVYSKINMKRQMNRNINLFWKKVNIVRAVSLPNFNVAAKIKTVLLVQG